jgi:hypothetical protein
MTLLHDVSYVCVINLNNVESLNGSETVVLFQDSPVFYAKDSPVCVLSDATQNYFHREGFQNLHQLPDLLSKNTSGIKTQSHTSTRNIRHTVTRV